VSERRAGEGRGEEREKGKGQDSRSSLTIKRLVIIHRSGPCRLESGSGSRAVFECLVGERAYVGGIVSDIY
jgi:hypothetical protein